MDDGAVEERFSEPEVVLLLQQLLKHNEPNQNRWTPRVQDPQGPGLSGPLRVQYTELRARLPVLVHVNDI